MMNLPKFCCGQHVTFVNEFTSKEIWTINIVIELKQLRGGPEYYYDIESDRGEIRREVMEKDLEIVESVIVPENKERSFEEVTPKIEYEVIGSVALCELSKHVMDFLNNGWVCQGGIFSDEKGYLQAMIREVK